MPPGWGPDEWIRGSSFGVGFSSWDHAPGRICDSCKEVDVFWNNHGRELDLHHRLYIKDGCGFQVLNLKPVEKCLKAV